MTNSPKVSVIVPIYGVEKYLRKAVDSILNQMFEDLEIILIDDGGKDGCPAIIDEYATKDKRVVAIHKPNGGYGSACNVGFFYASGEYVAIVEPDDFISFSMYKNLYDIAKKNDCDIVKSNFFTYYDIHGEKPKSFKQNWFQEIPNRKHKWIIPYGIFRIAEHPEFFYFHPSIWSCIYKRSFIEKYKIRMEEIPGAGWTDNLFQVQTFCLAERIAYTDIAFYHWRLKQKDDADDLKDLTIPFLRSHTIHKWMRDNNINDENVWACLYKREFTYMHIVFRVIKYKQLKELRILFNELLKDMSEKIIKTNKYISLYDIRAYRNFYYYYYCYYYKRKIIYLLSQVRKFIFTLHIPNNMIWHEHRLNIILFGFQIGRRRDINKDIPCWLTIKI